MHYKMYEHFGFKFDTKPKEMEYKDHRDYECICEGRYKDYHFAIINLGFHPCAYVKVPVANPYYGKVYNQLDDIVCHGGITYSRDYLGNKSGWWIGWDYAHADDFAGYYTEDDGDLWNNKRWTLCEMLDDVERVIRQLDSVGKGEE